MREAVQATGADGDQRSACPRHFAKMPFLKLLMQAFSWWFVYTEGIPTLDVLLVKQKLNETGVVMVGPNCPGVITPDEWRDWYYAREYP